jgi:hypothetical protein
MRRKVAWRICTVGVRLKADSGAIFSGLKGT